MQGTEITRGSGVALWRQIQDKLEKEIASGALEPEARCPTEFALAARFGVNRHTVRRAIAAMEEKGLLRVEQGRGTFVRGNVVNYPVRKRTRFSETITQQSRAPHGRLLLATEMAADAAVAGALDLAKGAPVVLLRTLGEVDGQPMVIADHYFDGVRCAGIQDAYEDTGSISRALDRMGVGDYLRKVTRVTARMPDRFEARHLRQPSNRPVLVSESVNVDSEGRPVEFGVARFAGDRVQIVFEP